VDFDPRVHRFQILRRDRAQRDHHLHLRQHVLVEHRRALRDEHAAEPTLPAAAHDVLAAPSIRASFSCGFCGAIASASSTIEHHRRPECFARLQAIESSRGRPS
jgi:hypothetical protein